MKFLRLTSVFLCCALLSSFLILPASAMDDNDYYSLFPVGASEPSVAMDWPVSPAVSHDGFLAEDSENLARIMTDLTTTGMNTVKTYIADIRDSLSRGGTIFEFLSDITDALTAQNVRGTLAWYIKDIDNLLSTINTSLGGGLATEETLSSISSKVATEITLASYLSTFTQTFGMATWLSPTQAGEIRYSVGWDSQNQQILYGSFNSVLWGLTRSLSEIGNNNFGVPTLYTRLAQLQEVLASDDDKALAESQKQNREQIEQDFLSGSSGKTSLGKDDFGSLSSVGGTFKDTISLNGQSSLSDLTSGLSDADSAGRGWFSQATKDSLDAVSGSGSSESTVSTFSDDGLYSVDVDLDPYHMQGFEDNYAWLWGDD